MINKLKEKLNNQSQRDIFIRSELSNIFDNAIILDAGCGSQRYKALCSRFQYRGQDFGEYVVDEKKALGSEGVGGGEGYSYGELYYKCDISNIPEESSSIDIILCTEVFEHLFNPIDAVKEFSRLLKSDGKLILTVPAVSLRHMDPYYFYSGFSDRWLERAMKENGFKIQKIETVDHYFKWIAIELLRIGKSEGIMAALALAPAFIYLISKIKSEKSVNTLVGGYHLVAIKC